MQHQQLSAGTSNNFKTGGAIGRTGPFFGSWDEP